MKWRVWNEDGEDGETIEAPTPADAAIAFARWYDARWADYPSARVVCVKPEMAVGAHAAKYAVTLEAKPDYSAERIP